MEKLCNLCLFIDLLSKDHDKSSTALLSLKDILNKSSQDDLREVCVELTKMLLHIDTLVDNIETRMNCLVLVTTKCPKEVSYMFNIHTLMHVSYYIYQLFITL